MGEATKCPSGSHGRHDFQARYDLSPAETHGLKLEVPEYAVAATINLYRKQTYVHDVCIRCGETRPRPTTGARE